MQGREARLPPLSISCARPCLVVFLSFTEPNPLESFDLSLKK